MEEKQNYLHLGDTCFLPRYGSKDRSLELSQEGLLIGGSDVGGRRVKNDRAFWPEQLEDAVALT